jgi:hypothetical protein
MKKIGLVCMGVLACVTLTACGNNKSADGGSTSQNSASQQTTNVNHRMASSSAKLAADNLTPQQNAALVLYYSGVKNNQSYVNQMNQSGQQVEITLYNTSAPDKLGIKDTVPSGAQVLYSVRLKNGGGSTYYTIVGDNTYISNSHGGFREQAVTNDEMVSLANKNNAGDMITNLASGVNINDQRNGGDSSSTTDDAEGEMTFDEAAELIQKGGFKDFNYDNAKSLHDGSHSTPDGGYVMITYPGAKGEDQFIITKTGKNKYHIEAKYGSAEGGSFTQYQGDDAEMYGPSSADVTK